MIKIIQYLIPYQLLIVQIEGKRKIGIFKK
jgi:hypothetical protein